MTKKQAPAPRPEKVVKTMPSRGKYIDFAPRKRHSAPAVRPQAPKKPVIDSVAPSPVRVSRTTVISTTKKKAPARDYIPPKKEEDFDEEDLFTELDFEENTPVILDEEDIASEAEETPEDFIAEKSVEEYTQALTALKVTAASESPFIASVSVDKRPLSDGRRRTEDDFAFAENAPTSIKEEEFHSPLRNVYTSRREPLPNRRYDNFDDDEDEPKIKLKKRREKDAKSSTRVVSPKEEKSSLFPLIIAITLMVIFGGVIGAVIYLAFFQ